MYTDAFRLIDINLFEASEWAYEQPKKNNRQTHVILMSEKEWKNLQWKITD